MRLRESTVGAALVQLTGLRPQVVVSERLAAAARIAPARYSSDISEVLQRPGGFPEAYRTRRAHMCASTPCAIGISPDDARFTADGTHSALVRAAIRRVPLSNEAMMRNENEPDMDVLPELAESHVPSGVDRRAFMMRSAMIGAVSVLSGCGADSPESAAAKAATATPPPAPPPSAAPPLSPDLGVVKNAKGPVMTTIDEFYKIGPGPSSSHTIGPMRITYDFYQRAAKLPPDQLAKATALKVNLFGSLSATGKGHGTERAALAGIIGKEPATINPLFLDELRDKPDQTFPVKLGSATFNVSLKDIIYDAPKGDFKHPNTMTCKLMAGDAVLLEQEYYSVGGGFIEWKGYEPPKKGQPKYPYSTMKELLAHAEQNKLTFAQVVMANEVAVSGKSEADVNAFVDKITTAMVNIVKSGLAAPP